MRKREMSSDCQCIDQLTVDKVSRQVPKEKDTMHLSAFFAILGDHTRLRILLALNVKEMCVCDIAVFMNMTKSAVSHQLSVLKKYKLVISRKEGKHNYYALSDEHVEQIIEMAVQHLKEQEN